jgi:threonine/homoserine/homoserine lactone efflux protein
MLAALGTVILTSLSGVMMPGPMFTVTLAKSLKSPWAGVWVSLGHAVIEVPLILLIYYGVAQFFQNTTVQFTLSFIGGAMIVWMGVSLFRARREVAQGGKDTSYNAFTAGILMSGLNPFFLVWWVTVGSLILMNFLEFSPHGLVLFIIAHWLCDFIWLTLVSVSIFKTRSFLSQKLQEWIFIACSLGLVYFGGNFIYKGIQLVA